MSTSSLARTRLTEVGVIELAEETAKREGYRVAEYKKPRVERTSLREEDTWIVYYERDVKYQYPGSCFYVFVSDQTRKARLARCE